MAQLGASKKNADNKRVKKILGKLNPEAFAAIEVLTDRRTRRNCASVAERPHNSIEKLRR